MPLTNVNLYSGFNLESPAINAPIEPGIQPVCDILNSIPDVYTLWSCEGHPERNKLPYVVFIAPQSFAFKVSKLFEPVESGNVLKYNWSLTANFRNDGSLQYVIRPDDYRIDKNHWNWFSLYRRKTMNAEIVQIASMISTLK